MIEIGFLAAMFQDPKYSDRLEGQTDDEDLAEVMELVEDQQTNGADLEVSPAENLEETNLGEDAKDVPRDGRQDLEKDDDQNMAPAEEPSGSGVFRRWFFQVLPHLPGCG